MGSVLATATWLFAAASSHAQFATDANDRYAILIDPLSPAIVGSNGYLLRPNVGGYTFQYSVVDLETGVPRLIRDCIPQNVLRIYSATAGLSTSVSPPFWRDPAKALTEAHVDCSQPDDPNALFLRGTYRVKIPLSDIEGRLNQAVLVWAFVDVEDRANADGPFGPVDSASGFLNLAKLSYVRYTFAADELDLSPTPVILTSVSGEAVSPCCLPAEDADPSIDGSQCNKSGVDPGPAGCLEIDPGTCIGGGGVASEDPEAQSPIAGCACVAGTCVSDGGVGDGPRPATPRECSRDAALGCQLLGRSHR